MGIMRITDEALQEFEVLWRQDNPGKEISREELADMATRVALAVELTYRPIPREKARKFKK